MTRHRNRIKPDVPLPPLAAKRLHPEFYRTSPLMLLFDKVRGYTGLDKMYTGCYGDSHLFQGAEGSAQLTRNRTSNKNWLCVLRIPAICEMQVFITAVWDNPTGGKTLTTL